VMLELNPASSHVPTNGSITETRIFGPWLWKQAKIKEEKGKCKLRGRHNDCYWVKVRKGVEKMEQSKRNKDI
jgi:hypothetical protein